MRGTRSAATTRWPPTRPRRGGRRLPPHLGRRGLARSAAWFPWCRAAARDEMEPDKVIVAMKVERRRSGDEGELVAEYVSGVAEHVRTLIGRGPAAADVEAALSRLEARPPSDWNEVISDSGMWHSVVLSAPSRGHRVARDRASDDVPLSIPERAREVPGNGLRGSPAR